jgi:uncharacterized membrane protein YcaP (DUF421 family)
MTEIKLDLFFHGWDNLIRTLVVGVLAYVTLVIFLRISGKRTLSKMNAFDLVVTVALGSTLATILLNKDVALAEGALAFTLLIGMQFIVTWSSVRVRWVRRLVTGEPSMLLYRGEFLSGALRHVRVTEDEVRAAVRAAGLRDLEAVEAVVLETDGSFSGGERCQERFLTQPYRCKSGRQIVNGQASVCALLRIAETQ